MELRRFENRDGFEAPCELLVGFRPPRRLTSARADSLGADTSRDGGMEFRLLGPLEVVDQGRSLPLGGPKQRSLLGVLLLHAGDIVSSERLIDEVWGGTPPATVAKSVQIYVSRLRQQIGAERLVTRAPGYVLRVGDDELDVARVERLVAEAARSDPDTAAARLREALALWRGPPLADLAYEPFARSAIARLQELRLPSSNSGSRPSSRAAATASVVGELDALVAEQPLRERPRRQLMLALYRSARQAEALEAYQAARVALVDGLGLEPGRELRELHQAILRQDPALDLAGRASVTGDRFVGRAGELAALATGLDEAFTGRGRLVLIAGEPGIGKSRLTEALGELARARGARVLVGRCWEAGGAPAYWPWVQSLRACVGDTPPATLRARLGAHAAELAQLLPELRDPGEDAPEPAPLDPDAARFRLFEAVTACLRHGGHAQPLVLVLDDVHAADEPSLLLLRFVARELHDLRLLVLAAYRDVDPVPGERLQAVVTDLARERTTTRLTLAGLGADGVGRFVALTAGAAASGEVVAAIHAETEGNPLFVEEIVRLQVAEGGLDEVAAHRARGLPPTVRDVIARRVRHLTAGCRQVLVLASVLGRECGLEALALLAYEEAARLYRLALGALGPRGTDGEAHLALLLSLGEAASRAGDGAAARSAFLAAAGAARRLGRRTDLARAAAGYGGRIVWARADGDEQLVPLLEEGLAAVGGADVELRARLLSRLAGALRDEPTRARRERLSAEAVTLARRTGSLPALAHALDGRLYASIDADSIGECLALGAELCDVAGRAGDAERLVQGHMHQFVARVTLGEIEAASADLARAERLAEQLRQPAQRWQARGAAHAGRARARGTPVRHGVAARHEPALRDRSAARRCPRRRPAVRAAAALRGLQRRRYGGRHARVRGAPARPGRGDAGTLGRGRRPAHRRHRPQRPHGRPAVARPQPARRRPAARPARPRGAAVASRRLSATANPARAGRSLVEARGVAGRACRAAALQGLQAMVDSPFPIAYK